MMEDETTAEVQLDVDFGQMESEPPARVLTVAGSDSGGGAGIQADLKTFAALGVFGMSVLTAITAQNTLGVQDVQMLDADFVGKQLDSVLSDFGADAVKTGMLGTKDIIEVVASKFKKYDAKNIVVDPVMVSTSGHALLLPDAIETYKSKLLPLATVITPNMKEAELLVGFEVATVEDMKRAARELLKFGAKWVLIKGGDKHGEREDAATSADVLFDGRTMSVIRAPRVLDTKNVHGTGCTLASAIAAILASDKNQDVYEAVCKAKVFITKLIHRSKALSLGEGVQGPMHHVWGTVP